MSVYHGRTGWLGIAIEGTSGTYQAPVNYVPYLSNDLAGKHEPIADVQARGLRDSEYNSVTGKKWSEGALEFNLDPLNCGYFFKMALGTENSAQVASSAAYDHTFTVKTDSQPVTSTLVFDKGAYREYYPYSTLKDLELSVSDGLATIKANMIGKFPVTTASGTNSQTAQTVFTFKDMTVQFGATHAAALAAAATKVKKLDFKINQNVEPIYRSGSQQPDSFAVKNFETNGSFDVLLEGATERDAYYNLTKQDCVITFTGAAIGSYAETVTINLYNIRFNDQKIETGIDDLFAVKSDFVAEYSTGDSKTVDVVVRNTKTTVY